MKKEIIEHLNYEEIYSLLKSNILSKEERISIKNIVKRRRIYELISLIISSVLIKEYKKALIRYKVEKI